MATQQTPAIRFSGILQIFEAICVSTTRENRLPIRFVVLQGRGDPFVGLHEATQEAKEVDGHADHGAGIEEREDFRAGEGDGFIGLGG
jgi:hypothetical protein